MALVIPPLVFRPDRRGLHDVVAGSATVTLQSAGSPGLTRAGGLALTTRGSCWGDRPPRKGTLVTTTLAVRRSLAAAALSSLALTGLVACGDSDGDDRRGPRAHVERQPQRHAPARAASDLQAGDTVSAADFTDLMAAGFENITTAHVTVETQAGMLGGMSGEGDVDYTGDSPATSMAMSSDTLGSDLEAIMVDGVMYMNMGDLSGNKYWKIDLNDKSGPFGSLGSQLDPKSSMDLLEKGLDSVTYVGPEDVAGQSLDHYSASVDPSALLSEMGGSASSGAAGLPKKFTYDIWLDDQNRLTKLTLDMGSAGSMTTELSGWGADVVDPGAARRPGHQDARHGHMTDSGGSAPASDAQGPSGPSCSAACPSCWSAPGPWASGRRTGWRRAP